MNKCKVKSIPVTEVTVGMQVGYKMNPLIGLSSGWSIGKVIELLTSGDKCARLEYSYNQNNCIPSHLVSLSELKTIVVEYDYDVNHLMEVDYKQVPLKYSDWQQSIDHELLDNDKEFDFDIVKTITLKFERGYEYPDKSIQVAKLKFSSKQIEYTVPKYIIENALDALRMAANTLDSRKRETAMDRQIEFSERLLKWVVNGGQGKVPNWIPRNDEK
jgi:hypothetical protein